MFRDDAECRSANRLKLVVTSKESNKPEWQLTNCQKEEYEDWAHSFLWLTCHTDKL